MPRTSIQIGGIRGLLRARRREAGQRIGLLGEAIRAQAVGAGIYWRPPRRRLLEFGSEGERGPPAGNEGGIEMV